MPKKGVWTIIRITEAIFQTEIKYPIYKRYTKIETRIWYGFIFCYDESKNEGGMRNLNKESNNELMRFTEGAGLRLLFIVKTR